MRVIILAAGYGTRLYPLTIDLPKPLIYIRNKPIINFLIEKINGLKKDYPIEGIKIVSNNKFYADFSDWKKKYKIKAEILNDGTTNPDNKLGAVKDIKFAIGRKNDDWLVLGGDNLFEDNLLEFMAFALRKKGYPCVGIYDVKNKKAASSYGIVEIDASNRIVKFEEKPKNPVSTLAATCVYFFPKESLETLRLFLSEVEDNDASGEYIRWLIDKTKVYGYILKNKWFDIGGNEALKAAEKEFKCS